MNQIDLEMTFKKHFTRGEEALISLILGILDPQPKSASSWGKLRSLKFRPEIIAVRERFELHRSALVELLRKSCVLDQFDPDAAAAALEGVVSAGAIIGVLTADIHPKTETAEDLLRQHLALRQKMKQPGAEVWKNVHKAESERIKRALTEIAKYGKKAGRPKNPEKRDAVMVRWLAVVYEDQTGRKASGPKTPWPGAKDAGKRRHSPFSELLALFLVVIDGKPRSVERICKIIRDARKMQRHKLAQFQGPSLPTG